jgi:raffinose/stachyose/melibiose transport system permease protein
MKDGIYGLGRKKYSLTQLLITIPIAIYSILTLYLLVNVFVSGFKSPSDFFTNPIGLPKDWVFGNYIEAWQKANFGIYFKNSVLVTLFSLVVSTVISCMAAYGIARYRYKFSGVAYIYFLAGLMFPAQLYVLPLFITLRNMNLLNTHPGLIIVYVATTQAFNIFLLVGFFKTLPVELEEAARIDGAGDYRIFMQIMLPLSKPIIATVLIMDLISVWNDFFYPLLLVQENKLRTIPLGLMAFFGDHNTQYHLLFAALSISIIPVAIAYMFSSKAFIKGLTAGSIK